MSLCHEGPEAFKLVYQEDKELVLKAESEKARDEWIKRMWNAVIVFTQTKRKQERSHRGKGKPYVWGTGGDEKGEEGSG